MARPRPTERLQDFLDSATAEGIAPGLQCIVFDRHSVLFNGVSGLSHLKNDAVSDGTPFTPETVLWLASCMKICLSLVVLHIIENDLTKSGFTVDDIENHDALVKILPEFEKNSGSLVTKIIEGFEDVDSDGKRIVKLRDAKNEVTLRHLLTHTSGTAYYWTHPLILELYRPSDGSVPHGVFPDLSGDIRDFEVPLVSEPGTAFAYGHAADWLGQFVVRGTGKNLRQLLKDIVFGPLGLPPSEIDIYLTPAQISSRAAVHVRVPGEHDNSDQFMSIPVQPYQTEGEPPDGKAHFASASLYGSSQTFAKVLQAVLRQDTRLLSAATWKTALRNNLEVNGIAIPKPMWKSALPELSYDGPELSPSTAEDGAGMNLLQCLVAPAPTRSGRHAGSFGWVGLANTYYFIDPMTGIGGIISAQVLPLFDCQIAVLNQNFEKLVYEVFGNRLDGISG